MGYMKQGFVNNDETKPLRAEQLIAMEDAIIANENELTNKQPKGNYLTEHLKLKTINGVSIVGEGNLEISGSGEVETQQAYVPVKWLGNTGTQYIDTGYVLQEDDVLEVDYEIPGEALSVKTDKILIDARHHCYRQT